METAFKVGDRVRWTQTNALVAMVEAGDLGTIREVCGHVLYVEPDVWRGVDPTVRQWAATARFLEPAPATPTPPTFGTPDRVRAQHAAERLVASMFGIKRSQARSDQTYRQAYRAAYRAFRQAQKEGAP